MAGAYRVLLVILQDDPLAIEDKDFMLVRVGMLGRVAADGHLELTHRETGRVIVFAEQTSYLATDRPGMSTGDCVTLV